MILTRTECFFKFLAFIQVFPCDLEVFGGVKMEIQIVENEQKALFLYRFASVGKMEV